MPKGFKHSEASKKKIGEAAKGRKLSEEVKRRMSESSKGFKHSEETRQKSSEARKGENNPFWGKHHSEETRRKMSEARGGENNSNYGKHHSHSEEAKRKISESHEGENNSNWKGGITLLEDQIRCHFKYRQWRSDVLTRDNFTCQMCGERGTRLHTHHIKPFAEILQFYEITTLEEALLCDELWNINNGKTLCRLCHRKEHIKMREEVIEKKPVRKIPVEI